MSPGLSVTDGAATVGVVFVGVEVVVFAGGGTVGVDTGGAAAFPLLKTPAAARMARKMAMTERAMIATCVIVNVRPPMTTSRWPGERASSSSGSIHTSSASS